MFIGGVGKAVRRDDGSPRLLQVLRSKYDIADALHLCTPSVLHGLGSLLLVELDMVREIDGVHPKQVEAT